MGSNSFGTLFRITTWGESHGPAVGVVIDGCPAGLELTVDVINQALAARAPGNSPYTSPRQEEDVAEILSGLFEGKTTGAPLSIVIRNRDAQPAHYESLRHLLRPGHANYTYLEKYGLFDHRGGGRASARETACRVAAGAVARSLLRHFDIDVHAYLKQIGPITAKTREISPEMEELLRRVKEEGDSIGGVVEFIASNVPVGLGDPVYSKLEANLASALMSLPATKGFEIGEGFAAAVARGSAHNDLFIREGDHVTTPTNNAGGVLAGIATGLPLIGRVAFKPTSSIRKPQETLTTGHEPAFLELPPGSRHDPCVAIRAAVVVEAMVALVLADALLMNRCARL